MVRSSEIASLSVKQKKKILKRTLRAMKKKFYKPDLLGDEWEAMIAHHRPIIESAPSQGTFEVAMNDLLRVLKTSHLGFFHKSARRASSKAALSATYLAEDTPYGKRWIFQGVHSGGAAARAGIQAGDILLSVDDREIVPPEEPVFAMGEMSRVRLDSVEQRQRTVIIDVARPKEKKLHRLEPTLVETRHLGDGLGYLKVAMFPGDLGIDVANEISQATSRLGVIDGLIIDLRSNTGGGAGCLRVMSLLTPGEIPVGFSPDKKWSAEQIESKKQRAVRFRRIPSSQNPLRREPKSENGWFERYAPGWMRGLPMAITAGLLAIRYYLPSYVLRVPIVLATESLGKRRFHGSVILLVDRHTASAGEMIAAFARENKLATIVGEKTAGRLLGATSVRVKRGFRLALPTGCYYTWKGSVLEGAPIEPDVSVDFDWRELRAGRDVQLECAVDIFRRERSSVHDRPPASSGLQSTR